MHIPAERVQKEMAREPAYLWFVPAIGNDPFAILVKVPSPVIRAVVKGSAVQFRFAVKFARTKSYLAVALGVHDDPASPFNVSKIQRTRREHKALFQILNRSRTPIFFFDELSRCVAWGYCNPSEECRNNAVALLEENDRLLFVGKFNKFCDTVLDSLEG